jgi:release factor glutamine methyltransferase
MTGYLREHGVPGPRLDAEVLLAHVLRVERERLYRDPGRTLSEPERERYRQLARRRARQRVPVAYLVGAREFWSHQFTVTPDVLIPRPETERLVEVALALAHSHPIREILEIGVGSGVLAGAIALELPAVRLVALDRSRPALAVARRNLERLGVSQRVTLIQADITEGLRGPFDLVVSNPPYVPSRGLRDLAPEVRHEPVLALDGGADGLAPIRRMVKELPALLARPGYVALEVGDGQAAKVCELLTGAGAGRLETHRDLAGVERVVAACFRRA